MAAAIGCNAATSVAIIQPDGPSHLAITTVMAPKSAPTSPDVGHRRCPLRDSVAREAGDGSIGLPAPSRTENRISVAPLLRVIPLSPYPPLSTYLDAVGVAGRPAAMSFSTIALRLGVVSTQRVTATRSFSQSM